MVGDSFGCSSGVVGVAKRCWSGCSRRSSSAIINSSHLIAMKCLPNILKRKRNSFWIVQWVALAPVLYPGESTTSQKISQMAELRVQ